MNLNLPTSSLLKISGKIELGKSASLASPILAIVISFLVVLFVVWPKFSEVLRMFPANEQLTKRANALSAKADKLSTFDKDVLEDQLVAAEELLPSEKAIFSLISQLEAAAASSGVVLSRVDVAPGSLSSGAGDKQDSSPAPSNAQAAGSADVSGSPKVTVKLSVSSDYRSFLQFATNMLSSARVVSLEDLSISAASSGNQIKVSLTLQAYWQALPTQLPSIESDLVSLSDEQIQRLSQVTLAGPSAAPPAIPSVPLGRTDLFAPF